MCARKTVKEPSIPSEGHPRVASLALRAIHLQVARRSRVGGVEAKSLEYVGNIEPSTPQSASLTAPLEGSLKMLFYFSTRAQNRSILSAMVFRAERQKSLSVRSMSATFAVSSADAMEVV